MLRSLIVPAVLAAALIAPAGAFAQQQTSQPANAPAAGQWEGHGHHHGGMMRMMRGLNLTDAQKAQLKQIHEQFRQSHPATAGQRPDPQAMKQLRDQMMNVLTPQQRAKLQTEMQQRAGQPQPQSTPQQ